MRPLTTEEKQILSEQRTCYLCKGDLGTDRDLDHCHYTGEPLGSYTRIKYNRFLKILDKKK